MHTLKIKAHIDSRHRIEIQLPADTPEGDADVIVMIPSPSSSKEQGLRTFFDDLDRHPPYQQYSKEEIDAYLAKERASWD
jgi:hypothetical protein